MKWVIRLYSLILLAYCGWRTFDFISSQLPKTDISFWLSIAFLFATETGLLLWHEISLNHTTTREQHYVSVWLTWIDFVGSLAAGTADMILRQTLVNGYQVPPALAQFLIFGLPLIMAGNVGAVLIYLSNDSEAQLERGKKELRFEIYRQAIKELHDNTGQLAEGMKKDIFKELAADVTGKVARQFLKASRVESEQPAPQLVRSNGSRPATVTYNAEAQAEPPLAETNGHGKDGSPNSSRPA